MKNKKNFTDAEISLIAQVYLMHEHITETDDWRNCFIAFYHPCGGDNFYLPKLINHFPSYQRWEDTDYVENYIMPPQDERFNILKNKIQNLIETCEKHSEIFRRYINKKIP